MAFPMHALKYKLILFMNAKCKMQNQPSQQSAIIVCAQYKHTHTQHTHARFPLLLIMLHLAGTTRSYTDDYWNSAYYVECMAVHFACVAAGCDLNYQMPPTH